jgi:hypothetical protein
MESLKCSQPGWTFKFYVFFVLIHPNHSQSPYAMLRIWKVCEAVYEWNLLVRFLCAQQKAESTQAIIIGSDRAWAPW